MLLFLFCYGVKGVRADIFFRNHLLFRSLNSDLLSAISINLTTSMRFTSRTPGSQISFRFRLYRSRNNRSRSLLVLTPEVVSLYRDINSSASENERSISTNRSRKLIPSWKRPYNLSAYVL